MSTLPAMLHLGHHLSEPERPLTLPVAALSRHVMALGSSGSGKTVLAKVVVEEAVRAGIPAICIDPQGDLCSLALSGDAAFGDLVDAVVFTPASRKGVPLCADPLGAGYLALGPAERTHAMSRAAAIVVSLLGYDLDSDDGSGLRAVIDAALADLFAAGRPATRLEDLSRYLTELDAAALARYGRFLDGRKIRVACQRLARLDVGSRRLLFHDGVPLDIDVLLGRGAAAGAVEGKVRIAIVYLNTLHGQDDKDFFVATLVDRLYGWMLRHPSSEPQALFYIDEVAPFIPPVRKPACKDSLQLLFKQARKYGVSCLMATQNPGDVDYRAMAQFGTWALGRLGTRQDLKKVEPTIKGLAPAAAESILATLPSRKPGEFVVISPDHLTEPTALKVRWLLSEHQTLDEAQISALGAERWEGRDWGEREREEQGGHEDDHDGEQEGEDDDEDGNAGGDDDDDEDEDDHEHAHDDHDHDRAHDGGTGAVLVDADGAVVGTAVVRRGVVGDERARFVDAVEDGEAWAAWARVSERQESGGGEAAVRDAIEVHDAIDARALAGRRGSNRAQAELDRLERVLAEEDLMTARELAGRAGISESKSRRVLRELVAAGIAGKLKQGRTLRFWSLRAGGRPDLGLPRRVRALVPTIDRARIDSIAGAGARGKLLGLLGEDERVATAERVYRPVFRLAFEERVERSVLARMVGGGPDHLLGSVYVHPGTLQVVIYTPRGGIRFVSETPPLASRVDDFDGVTTAEEIAPAELLLDEEAWARRRPVAEIERSFAARFSATVTAIEPVFVPLWKVLYRRDGGANLRLAWVDALAGLPVEWPS